MDYAIAFIAGFAATLTFHQGMLALLHAAGLWPRPAFAMARTGPFHVPAVVSLAFWGGLWGIAFWVVLGGMTGASYWIWAIVFGAVGPSLVALFVVFPLKKMPVAGGWNPKVIGAVLALNAAWGLGVAIFMRIATL